MDALTNRQVSALFRDELGNVWRRPIPYPTPITVAVETLRPIRSEFGHPTGAEVVVVMWFRSVLCLTRSGEVLLEFERPEEWRCGNRTHRR